ncbi:ATP-binding protein, partial [Streptomyces luridiscabiei]|uniref:ATP-binding protein n=1 Tax=Streptomyces luridiscabiei TaxID=164114 RepID=UPI000A585823
MAPIPLQRDTVQRPGTTRAGYAHGPRLASRTSLPGIPLAPSAARRFVRAALAEWTGLGVPAAVGFSDRLADDAVTVTNELVTNAVVHAGTTVDLVLRLEEEGGDEPSAALVLEVTDHHPARPVGGDEPGATGAPGRKATDPTTDPATEPPAESTAGLPDPAEYGRGLQLVATLAESWGITYRTGLKTVWARLPVD